MLTGFVLWQRAIVLGVVLLLATAVQAARVWRLLKNGETTRGVVARLEQVGSDLSPVVRFTTRDRRTIEFVPRHSGPQDDWTLGASMTVIYDPAAPENARIHRSAQLWSLTWLLLVGALVSLTTGGVLKLLAD
jgi:hypothetical protein